jgi:hypothetical protein
MDTESTHLHRSSEVQSLKSFAEEAFIKPNEKTNRIIFFMNFIIGNQEKRKVKIESSLDKAIKTS